MALSKDVQRAIDLVERTFDRIEIRQMALDGFVSATKGLSDTERRAAVKALGEMYTRKSVAAGLR